MNARAERVAPRWLLGLYGLLVLLFFGVVGVITAGSALGLAAWSAAQADVDKHGVAEMNQSRLGGAAVLFGVCAGLMVFVVLGESRGILPEMISRPTVLLALVLVAAVGFAEDVRGAIPVGLRLVGLVGASALALFGAPEIAPTTVGTAWSEALLAIPAVSAACVIFVVCGFINAGNAADGANGLMGGVLFAATIGLYVAQPSMALMLLAHGLFAFLIFNVWRGNIFLGDGGCYGLSALICLLALETYTSGNAGLWYLASLVSYPCLDFLWTIISRALRRRSPLQAGDDHLHNRVYAWLKPRTRTPLRANSLTGTGLAALFALAPLALTLILGVDHAAWFWVYLVLVVLYGTLRITLRRALAAGA